MGGSVRVTVVKGLLGASCQLVLYFVGFQLLQLLSYLEGVLILCFSLNCLVSNL